MHDHISIAYNSRSKGMKLILVLFDSYRVEDFFRFRNLCLFTYSICFSSFEVTEGILTQH